MHKQSMCTFLFIISPYFDIMNYQDYFVRPRGTLLERLSTIIWKRLYNIFEVIIRLYNNWDIQTNHIFFEIF